MRILGKIISSIFFVSLQGPKLASKQSSGGREGTPVATTTLPCVCAVQPDLDEQERDALGGPNGVFQGEHLSEIIHGPFIARLKGGPFNLVNERDGLGDGDLARLDGSTGQV